MKKSVKSAKAPVFKIIFCTLLSFYTILFIVLLMWMLLSTFKSKSEFDFYPLDFPKKFVFSNYPEVMKKLYIDIVISGVGKVRYSFIEMFGTSLLYSVGCTLVSVGFKAISGYVFAKYNFKLKGFLFSTAMVVMVIPTVGQLASELDIAKAIGFYDNIWGLMIMKGGFGGMAFLIFYSVFRGVPWEYAESAQLDGAGHFRIMLTIMFPMIKATLGFYLLTSFIEYWNDWSVSVVYMPSRPLAAYAIYYFQKSTENVIALGGVPYVLTSSVIFCIPVFILFMIFKKQLFTNLNFGGIKG
ncbi:MAG: carbohydrate ABC transporter permease [Candidatus Borkfalkiaceae bacterium]|nr:carbohydrate ABC transporter permease [Christensenellaceae bacterium]